LSTGEQILRKQQPVLGGYDPKQYVSERLHATAPDGTRIPLSVVYRRDTPRDASTPLLLYGYGSYGISVPVSFSSNRLSLLDRGVIYAIAHVARRANSASPGTTRRACTKSATRSPTSSPLPNMSSPRATPPRKS